MSFARSLALSRSFSLTFSLKSRHIGNSDHHGRNWIRREKTATQKHLEPTWPRTFFLFFLLALLLSLFLFLWFFSLFSFPSCLPCYSSSCSLASLFPPAHLALLLLFALSFSSNSFCHSSLALRRSPSLSVTLSLARSLALSLSPALSPRSFSSILPKRSPEKSNVISSN